MSSVCARVKTLRKILAEVLSAGDFEWANIQYCARNKQRERVTKKVCPDDTIESPIACTQAPKCAKPLTVITTGLGSPPSWPLEWEVETRIVNNPLIPFIKGERDWAKNIKPGSTLCVLNSAMEGHCLKFKNRFSATEKQRLQAISPLRALVHPVRERGTECLPREISRNIMWNNTNYTLSHGVKEKTSYTLSHGVNSHPTEKAATDLLMDLAESICEISLTKQVRQLWKKGKRR